MSGMLQKTDDLMTMLFGQLEILQELAVKAGDAQLAQDLSAAFAASLSRYCDAQRADLIQRLEAAPERRQA